MNSPTSGNINIYWNLVCDRQFAKGFYWTYPYKAVTDFEKKKKKHYLQFTEKRNEPQRCKMTCIWSHAKEALAKSEMQIKPFFLSFFNFLGLYMWHMIVPSLGVELELQLLAYTTATTTRDLSLHQSSWQPQILSALSEARDRTHILMDTFGFITAETRWELPSLFYFLTS